MLNYEFIFNQGGTKMDELEAVSKIRIFLRQ